MTPTIPAKKAKAREFQDCYCAGIGLCQAPSSRIDRPELTTIRNEAVSMIQPRPRANADARITALRGCESSSAARSSSSAKRRSSPGARQIRLVLATDAVVVGGSGGFNQNVQSAHSVDRFYPERLCRKAPSRIRNDFTTEQTSPTTFGFQLTPLRLRRPRTQSSQRTDKCVISYQWRS